MKSRGIAAVIGILAAVIGFLAAVIGFLAAVIILGGEGREEDAAAHPHSLFNPLLRSY